MSYGNLGLLLQQNTTPACLIQTLLSEQGPEVVDSNSLHFRTFTCFMVFAKGKVNFPLGIRLSLVFRFFLLIPEPSAQ